MVFTDPDLPWFALVFMVDSVFSMIFGAVFIVLIEISALSLILHWFALVLQ